MTYYDGEVLVDKIRRICKEKGISIAQMEKDLSWSQGLISRWTKNSPSIGRIMEVMHYLNVTYEELFGDISPGEGREPEAENVSHKLYQATELGHLGWKACESHFDNEDVQNVLSENAECKIYYTNFESIVFLLILGREDPGELEIGTVYGKKGKIVYLPECSEEWAEALLQQIDGDEFDKWIEWKTKYYIKRFMRTDFS